MMRLPWLKQDAVAEDAEPVLNTDVRPTIRAGLAIVAVMVVGFFGWASFTPLASGVHVMGKVAVDSDRKTIQHLEGGIVRDILVKEGARVRKDDLLLVIEGTMAKANRERTLSRYLLDRITEARLLADQRGSMQFPIPEDLNDYKNDPRLVALWQDQSNILRENRRLFEEQFAIQKERIAQLKHQIQGNEANRRSTASQLELAVSENSAIQSMFGHGFATASQARSAERDVTNLQGQYQSLEAEYNRLLSQLAEANQLLSQLRVNHQKEIADQLDAVRAKLRDSLEMLKSADDEQRRLEIRAPQDGQVVGLAIHTIGGVVAPGMALMFIVPENERLILDAQLRPLDASYVHAGMFAEVKFSGLPKRTTPLLRGHVMNVSSDTLSDPDTRMPYYLVRVEVGADQVKLMEGSTITPGMPVEVLLEADKRTVMEYLLAPWTDLFRKAMREH